MKFLINFFFLLSCSVAIAQETELKQTDYIDFTEVEAEVSIHPRAGAIEGTAKYKFEVLRDIDSVYIDARNMDFSLVELNGKKVPYSNTGSRLWIKNSFKPSADNNIRLLYNAKPRQAMYFINWNIEENVKASRQVWTQGQGRYTSHWLPSFDNMEEKAVFSLKINFKEGYEVISNGLLQEKRSLNDSIEQWHYAMQNPMSSYLLAIAIGEYEKETMTSSSGVEIINYFEAGDRAKVEPTYRHTVEIFDFFEKQTGVSFPWQNYKQVPVQDFLYSGMENTGATIFSDALVVDEIGFNDQNYVNVNAHELAHQWFGNMVTAKSNEHHWLQEGFATFFALLAEKEILGEDHYYWKLFQSAEELKTLSDQGKGEMLVSSRGSSLTYYQKGAWALHMLQEEIGVVAFKTAVTNFLKKFAYSSATTEDFLIEARAAYGSDLQEFESDWLLQSAFQSTAALESLKKSNFIREYMEIAALREVPFDSKKDILSRALDFPVNDYIGQEVVYQLNGDNGEEVMNLYRKAFKSGNLYVRQAIAVSTEIVPEELKAEFISLLEDRSYITIENALLNLWLTYPEEAGRWLEATRDIEGLSNRNVELLWLVINLVSPQVEPEKTSQYFEKLSGYTRSNYSFEIRQNAFGYLYQINTFSDQNLRDLLQAGQHHNIRFRDFSRKLLETLLQDEKYREKYVDLSEDLSSENREFLNTRLKLQTPVR
ncbi:MAG TPA: M1 family metallopeptidase [Gillisia sp.]|nr:M1 family metallopeptidase [Gillisia sp.]